MFLKNTDFSYNLVLYRGNLSEFFFPAKKILRKISFSLSSTQQQQNIVSLGKNIWNWLVSHTKFSQKANQPPNKTFSLSYTNRKKILIKSLFFLLGYTHEKKQKKQNNFFWNTFFIFTEKWRNLEKISSQDFFSQSDCR